MVYVQNADPSHGDVALLFDGDVAAIVKGYDASQAAPKLTVVVPPDAHSGPVTLRVGCQEYVGPEAFVVDDIPAAVVTSATPMTAPAGSMMTLTGSNLTTASLVSIGSELQMFVIVDDTTIEFSAAQSGTTGPLTIETSSGLTRTDIVLTVQ